MTGLENIAHLIAKPPIPSQVRFHGFRRLRIANNYFAVLGEIERVFRDYGVRA